MSKKKQVQNAEPVFAQGQLYQWSVVTVQPGEERLVHLRTCDDVQALTAAGLDQYNGNCGRREIEEQLASRASLTAAEEQMWKDGLALLQAHTPEHRAGAVPGTFTKGASAPTQNSDTVIDALREADLQRAIKVVRAAGYAKVSDLQRTLRLGYAAGRAMIEEMQRRQLVGPWEEDGRCQVLAAAVAAGAGFPAVVTPVQPGDIVVNPPPAVELTATGPLLVAIPVAQIIPTPDNPRAMLALNAEAYAELRAAVRAVLAEPARSADLVHGPHRGLVELAVSIASHGQIQAALVRPHPTQAGMYDLRCGHRRLAACLLAGVPTLLCQVRELTDQQAYEATVTENLQRQDLNPLEEGRAVAGLLAHGWDVAAVAGHIGKSPDWVLRRASLAKLSKAWQEELAAPPRPEGEEDDEDSLPNNGNRSWSFAATPANLLELVARFSPAVQDTLLQTLRRSYWRPTMAAVVELVGNLLRELSKAPWKLDDAHLVPGAGACAACPKRSACQAVLFPELDPENDHCLDAACWAQKTAAHVALQEERLRAQHPALVLVTEEWSRPAAVRQTGDEEEDEEADAAGSPAGTYQARAVPRSSYSECKRKDAGALPALRVDGHQAGTLCWVTLHGKAAKQGADGQTKPKTLAERRQALEEKRAAHVLQQLRDALMRQKGEDSRWQVPAGITKLPQSDQEQCFLQLTLVLGVTEYSEWDDEIKELEAAVSPARHGTKKQLAGILSQQSTGTLYSLLWGKLTTKLLGTINAFNNGDALVKLAVAPLICDLLDLQLAELTAAAVSACPAPKAWKNLNEDGTPKAAGKDGAK